MTTPLERCPRDGYALIRGVCPVCGGKRVADRLPMPAPLPAKPEPQPKRKRYGFPRRRSA